MIRSPISYPGGKSRAIKYIDPLIPDFKEFREPFVGGGSVFFHLKQKYPDKQFWINDINKWLCCFWKHVQQNVDKLIKQICDWKNLYKEDNARELYKYLYENLNNFSELEVASAFYCLSKMGFGGIVGRWAYSNIASKKFFKFSNIEKIKKVSELMKNVKITNLDFQEVIQEKGENVFIFLDPPYLNEESKFYGKDGMYHKGFDHERLANVLKNTEHKWLMTYNNNPYIKELYSFANIIEREISYCMTLLKKSEQNSTRKKGVELFISNYPINLS